MGFQLKDKVCYKGKPYKVIGRKLDRSFFVILGLDRQQHTVHKKYLKGIEC